VQKPGGGPPRVTVDLRRLNAITAKETCAMPVINDSLDFLSESKYLSVLDCTQSYFHIPLRECDKEKTAFLTRKGAFQFCVLPQGATNAPAIFCRLMALVLRGLNYLCCLSFVDDLIVIGRTFEEHLMSLELVFHRLRYAGLKLKPTKCKLFQAEVNYLGFIVSGDYISTDTAKTACIKTWPFPTNISELRILIGFLSYYRNFLPGFAARVEPLSEMLRKDEPIEPTAKRLAAFNDLKNALINAPALGIFRSEGDVVIDVDTSSTSCGAVCSQYQNNVLRPLCYASRCLSKAERNLCAYRREILGLIFGLKKFRPYVLGRPFVVCVDNMALKYLLTVKNPTAQLARHLDFLADYNFTLEHRLGKNHANCDALSRLPPCRAGPDNEPCRQCRKLVTGDHVQVVTTRRQAKMQPLFAPILPVPASIVATDNTVCDDDVLMNDACNGDADVPCDIASSDDNDDAAVNDVNINYSADVGPALGMPLPTGLLARTSPTAAAHLEAWNPIQLREAQLHDTDIAGALMAVESGRKPHQSEAKCVSPALRSLYNQFDTLLVLDGVLHRIFYDTNGAVQHYQLVMPHSLKRDFLELVHNDLCAHLGVKKCRPQVQRRAWWHSWKTDLDLFIRCCDKCNSYHRGSAPKQGLLHPMVVDSVGTRWSIDLCGEFPMSNGYKYIFTAICVFSKYAIIIPIRNKSAETVARVIVDRLLLTHSFPQELLSDNGTEFCNSLSDELYKILRIRRLKTTARKASTNGCVECLHKTLNSIIAKLVSDSHSDWSTLLPYCAFSYNTCVHSSTGFSPFFVMYGREPNCNIDMLLCNIEPKLQNVPQYTARLVEWLRTTHNIVRERLNVQAKYMSTWYNRKVREKEFAVGEEVRVFDDSTRSGRCTKWLHFYKDVAVVKARLNDVTYLLSCPTWRTDRVIHVDKLKRVTHFSTSAELAA